MTKTDTEYKGKEWNEIIFGDAQNVIYFFPFSHHWKIKMGTQTTDEISFSHLATVFEAFYFPKLINLSSIWDEEAHFAETS